MDIQGLHSIPTHPQIIMEEFFVACQTVLSEICAMDKRSLSNATLVLPVFYFFLQNKKANAG